MIRRLDVEGYRSIRVVSLRLDRINVLTGPNGCGKSNLYNAMVLLARAAAGGFAASVAEEGGMSSVLWAGPEGKRLTRQRPPVRILLAVELDDYGYGIEVGLPRPGSSMFSGDPEVKEESIWQSGRRNTRLRFLAREGAVAHLRDAEGRMVRYSHTLLPSESVLAQILAPHLYPEFSALRTEMQQWRFYHQFRTDPHSPLRQPRHGVATPVLSADGADLASALATIAEIGDRASLDEAVAGGLRGARVRAVKDDRGCFRVVLDVPGLLRPLDARELSDGTLRYLCLLAALLSPRPPALLALNEPETSLHPDLIDPLARLIVRASRGTQLWITTHAARLAQAIEEESGIPAVRLEMVDGETRIAVQPGSS